jgi:hypothetical protein
MGIAYTAGQLRMTAIVRPVDFATSHTVTIRSLHTEFEFRVRCSHRLHAMQTTCM